MISKAIFKDKQILVQGFDWCQGYEKEVSLESLVRKHLCRHHNSILSPVDEAGARIMETLEDDRPGAEHRVLDGEMCERWLLKIAINTAYGGRDILGVGMRDAAPGKVPRYLLDVVFGHQPFVLSMGAYFLFPKGPFLHRGGEIVTTPLIKNGEIGGFYFHLRGFDVFLSLFPGHSLPALGELGLIPLPSHVLNAKPIYRCRILTTHLFGNPPRTVRFVWPACRSAAAEVDTNVQA